MGKGEFLGVFEWGGRKMKDRSKGIFILIKGF